MVVYLTLDELKAKYWGEWNDEWDAFATDKLVVASRFIDRTFKAYGYTVEGRILSGDLYVDELKEVMAQVVLGLITYNVSQGTLAQVTSMSESAGQYSVQMAFSTNYSRRTIYLMSSELEMLGLESVIWTSISMLGD